MYTLDCTDTFTFNNSLISSQICGFNFSLIGDEEVCVCVCGKWAIMHVLYSVSIHFRSTKADAYMQKKQMDKLLRQIPLI